jgi:hypothetical protein
MEPEGWLSHSQELSTYSYPEQKQSCPLKPISPTCILKLSTHLYLGLPSCLFLLAFPPITYTRSSFHHSCYMPRPYTLLGSVIVFTLGEQYRLRSSSLWSFLHSPVTSSLFGPNFLLSILFWNTLSLCSSLNIRDQVSHPYKTKGKILVLCILILIFFYSREDRRFPTEW